MIIEILDEAQEDLIKGFHFYKDREPKIGLYFLDCLFSNIDSLSVPRLTDEPRGDVRRLGKYSGAVGGTMLPSALDISSMAHMDNGDGLLPIVNIVEHPIIPDPQAPSFTANQPA